jgi:mono/diheme cytochrome c family protein
MRILLVGALAVIGNCALAQDTSLIERGRYLAAIGICESCHTPKNPQGVSQSGMEMSGGHRVGGVLASNITPDKETGIGAWSDQQIIDSIRNGKRPNGELVRPPMGVFFYRSISDGDAQAIVAYLRSVPPVQNKVERLEGRGPTPTFAPVTTVAAPDRKDRVAYGKYIGETIAHCYQCHTPRKDGLPDLSKAGAGGNTYTARGGGQVTASNITQAALAGWSDEQIKAAIKKGVRPDGSNLSAVMDFELYDKFASDDLDALIAYMRSVPAMK